MTSWEVLVKRVSYLRVVIGLGANIEISQSYGYETLLRETITRMGDLLGSPRERVSYLAYPNLFGTKGLEEEEEVQSFKSKPLASPHDTNILFKTT